MTTTTMNNNVTANEQAAEQANTMFNGKKFKGVLVNLATIASNSLNALLNSVQDVSKMDEKQTRVTVMGMFDSARKTIAKEIKFLNSIPAFKNGRSVKNLEEALVMFTDMEKEILSVKDINVLKKLVCMFWSGIKFICGLITKSVITAGKFVAVYGVRFLAIGADFIIKVVKKAVKAFKEVWSVVKTLKVMHEEQAHENAEVAEETTVEEEE